MEPESLFQGILRYLNKLNPTGFGMSVHRSLPSAYQQAVPRFVGMLDPFQFHTTVGRETHNAFRDLLSTPGPAEEEIKLTDVLAMSPDPPMDSGYRGPYGAYNPGGSGATQGSIVQGSDPYWGPYGGYDPSVDYSVPSEVPMDVPDSADVSPQTILEIAQGMSVPELVEPGVTEEPKLKWPWEIEELEMNMPKAVRPEGYIPDSGALKFAKAAVPTVASAVGGPIAGAAASIGMNLLAREIVGDPTPPPKPPSLLSEYLPRLDAVRQRTAEGVADMSERLIGSVTSAGPGAIGAVSERVLQQAGQQLAEADAMRAEHVTGAIRADQASDYQYDVMLSQFENQQKAEKAGMITDATNRAIAGVFAGLEHRDAVKRSNEMTGQYEDILNWLSSQYGVR